MTKVQREIHEWSLTCQAWQRDLLRRVAAGPLGDADRLAIRAMLLGAADAPPATPVDLDDLPADAGEHGDVMLMEIGDLRNINLIAPGQMLQFGPGLNVVYGDNGAGKSGYGRLLRRVCRAAVPGEVLRDVFDPDASTRPQTAVIVAGSKNRGERYEIDLAVRGPRVLSAVGVFDARCADFFLSKPSTIDWLPAGLRLLKELAAEQDAVAASLREEASLQRQTTQAVPEITQHTPAAEALAGLDADTDLGALERMGALSDPERDELAQLERTVALGKEGRTALRRAAVARATAARKVVTDLGDVAALIDDSPLAALDAAIARRAVAREAEAQIAGALAADALPGTGGGPWRELWRAAEAFVAEHGHSFPPTEGEPCPLCQQGVSADTAERMRVFREFVQGEQRRNAATANRTVDEWVDALPDPTMLSERVEERLAELGDDPVVAPARQLLDSVLGRMAAAQRRAAGDPTDAPPLQGSAEGLARLAEASDAEVARIDALDDGDEQRRALARMRELRGRRELGTAMPTIRGRATSLRRAKKLEEAARQLATNRITTLLNRLSQEVITDDLRAALISELKALGPIADKVRVRPRAAKGNFSVQLELAAEGATLNAVLSEGEQRALAIAFFLAESSMRTDGSALVFDDPVSSLDHDRRQLVAKRLVAEAANRQVIVFTHDLAFLMFLNEAARDAATPIDFRGQELRRVDGRVGS